MKTNFGGLLYFHGTPQRNSIGSAESHGCLRMHQADAVDFGRFLLAVDGQIEALDTIDDILPGWERTKLWKFDDPLPLEVRYSLLESEGPETLVLHGDVYGRLTTAHVDSLALLISDVVGETVLHYGADGTQRNVTSAQLWRWLAEAKRRQQPLRFVALATPNLEISPR